MDLFTKFLQCNREKQLKVNVFGDVMIDKYYVVDVNRISPEVPMPIMHSDHTPPVCRPGGAANVAYQLHNFNVDSNLFGFTDLNALHIINQHGLKGFFKPHPYTPEKYRFLHRAVQVNRWDLETQVNTDDTEQYFDQLLEYDSGKIDVAILSDYNKGFFTYDVKRRLIEKYKDILTIVDPKVGNIDEWKNCKIFKPNEKEAKALSGLDDCRQQAYFFKKRLDCEIVIITRGGNGVVGIDKNGYFEYQPPRKNIDVMSVIGAGDCFVSVLALALGHGFNALQAAEIAYQAGSIYVQNRHNRPIVPAELSTDGICHPLDLAKRDFKLAFTNGCFDLLHAGHIQTLQYAKDKADKLVVGVNSDASVKKLKGSTRPVVQLPDRLKVLTSLKMVDFVVSFDEDTPLQTIEMCRPDVLVKGGDYADKDIVGSDIVQEVYTASILEGISTSKIIGVLRDQC
jgi:D-beta-D-heptose 7-phosphate kinase/D-beta-D-heptose 1-phosphate adenosyltransferase